mgnify:CR=1 FL=1
MAPWLPPFQTDSPHDQSADNPVQRSSALENRMNPPDLLVISLSAFVAVFLLLSFLAVVMRLLLSAFPEKVGGIDAGTIAAVTAAAAYAFPGTKVTRVEEIR